VDQGRRPPFLLEERHVDAGVRILKAAAQKAAKQQKKVAASA
jgi:hypothetical protein